MTITRDIRLSRIARKYGARYALTIVREARRAGIPISLGFAIIEQESGFRNVFGNDPVANPVKGGEVTKARYLEYRHHRRVGRGMQGVGPAQLTWYEFQDRADKLGGCWVVTYNIRVGFQVLAANIKRHGSAVGIQRYNGSGDAAIRYQTQVQARANKWHDRLT